MAPLLIFDFDGVIADSELIANAVLAEVVTAIGVPTTVEDSLRLFAGKRIQEIVGTLAAALGGAVPEHFVPEYHQRTLDRFRTELRAVAGVREFISAFAHVPRCIASSSSPDRIGLCLEVLKLEAAFGGNVFSAAHVDRGKPFPDVFLRAAERMGADPSEAIVIEDSPTGVAAGVAAGMTVIGLLAASHVRDGHADRLTEAGAHYLARTFREAEAITRLLLAGV